MDKVKSGDKLRIRASQWNEIADTVRWAQTQKRIGAGDVTGRRAAPSVVRVRNDSVSDVAQYGVLGLDGGVVFGPLDNLDEFKDVPVLTAVTPVAETHAGNFVVALEPIRAGKIGLAVVAGAVQCKVDVQTEGDEWADAGNATTALVSGSSGSARILYVEAGTGVKWAIVRLDAVGAAGEKVRWAKAQAKWVDAAVPYVECKSVSNKAGEGESGSGFYVYLPRGKRVSGLQTVTSLTSSGITATATVAGHGFQTGDRVTISNASEMEYNGTYVVTVTGNDTFTYTFPGSATSPATGAITARGGRYPDKDPNVRIGDVIAYMIDANGDRVCVSDYMDDTIGTVKIWTDIANVPAGWQVCDGTNGTPDMRGRFVVGQKDGDDDFVMPGGTGGGKQIEVDPWTCVTPNIDIQTGGAFAYDVVHSVKLMGTNSDGSAADTDGDTVLPIILPPYIVAFYIMRVE